MRMAFSWDFFNEPHEKESLGFHDRPKGGVKGLAGKELEIPQEWVDRAKEELGGRTIHELMEARKEDPSIEAAWACQVDWCERFVRDANMTLKVVDMETFLREVKKDDAEFLVTVIEDGKVNMWFGYWEPAGYQFLRKNGGDASFPIKWLTPEVRDEEGNVLSPGSKPGIVMGKPTTWDELVKRWPKLAEARKQP